MLARPPWPDDPAHATPFRYAEYARLVTDRVWSSAVYGFAAATLRAFASHAWPADARGIDTDRRAGGLVDHLPVERFRTDTGLVSSRPSLDILLTDRQERLLVGAGLMPLSSIPFSDEAAFGAVCSLQTPAPHVGANAQAADARLSAQINTLLCISRFAHYLTMLGRNMVSAFRTQEEIERQLQAWLGRYVDNSTAAGPETRAKYPLVGARVLVRERPGRPGVFGCTIQLHPHFQLDDVSPIFRLVTDIAAPGAPR